jgi:hypothetical protein
LGEGADRRGHRLFGTKFRILCKITAFPDIMPGSMW